jgi:hypothetical protein
VECEENKTIDNRARFSFLINEEQQSQRHRPRTDPSLRLKRRSDRHLISFFETSSGGLRRVFRMVGYDIIMLLSFSLSHPSTHQ